MYSLSIWVSALSESTSTYQSAAKPAFEAERLRELHGLNILDTTPEKRFDRLAALAADIFYVPIALVSLVDDDRQWFKAKCGLTADSTSRDDAFCAHAILEDDLLVVEDTEQDPRFANNPLVVGPPYIRFYAGAVVRGPTGQPLGTLCVIDTLPRQFGDINQRRLKLMAELVNAELER